MNATLVLLGMDSVIIVIFFLIFVFSVGIVWRVEQELDLSYKCFVVAVGCLTLGELMGLYVSANIDVVLLGKGLRIGGVVFLLMSVLLMRDLVRKLDGEKTIGKK